MNSSYITTRLNDLGLDYQPEKESGTALNTNISAGYGKTIITKYDIDKFERFIDKIQFNVVSKIPYLRFYNPYLVHNIL